MKRNKAMAFFSYISILPANKPKANSASLETQLEAICFEMESHKKNYGEIENSIK